MGAPFPSQRLFRLALRVPSPFSAGRTFCAPFIILWLHLPHPTEPGYNVAGLVSIVVFGAIAP